MFDDIKTKIKDFFEVRTRILLLVLVALFCVLIYRCYYLQVLHSEEYKDNYVLKLEKETTIDAARGNIYDRYGNLLAYNELSYVLTIEDSGTYDKEHPKNTTLNAQIADIITAIEGFGDSCDNDFGIIINSKGDYAFRNSGSSLLRFKADVFGYSSTADLGYNDDFDFDEADATADQVMQYLMSSKKYNVSDEYDKEHAYKIVNIRYRLSQNSYQKYLTTTIASDISNESVAYIEEHLSEYQGIEIQKTLIRRYVDSKYFAHIIGYTGVISDSEYEELSKVSTKYSLTDVVGKSGIEQNMDLYLKGEKGSSTVYVDSTGNLLETISEKDAVPGDDVYLSIDMYLQEAVYNLLEQELAGILYSKIINVKEYENTSDIYIPIYDVYKALIDNLLIKTDHFTAEDASDTERAVYSAFEQRQAQVLEQLKIQLSSANGYVYDTLTPEYQDYSTYVVKYLKSHDLFDSSLIDANAEEQIQWTSEKMSVHDYLIFCIENNWIDITNFTGDSKYVDSEDIYNNLVDFIIETFGSDTDFSNMVYDNLIMDDTISGYQLCKILYDQGVLDASDSTSQSFLSGGTTPYTLLTEKIRDIDITPGELGLDPCSASCVVSDVTTGELLACVSYPGYDNNKMANSVDSDYYYYLNHTASNPLYNYATQQRTAPGSTFKPVSATTGLAEGVITPYEEILDEGIFTKLNNSIKCWAYPSNHGMENLSEAITDSCNYYFNEVGMRLSMVNGNYDADTGLDKLSHYADLYGLDEKTGIEIEEYTSKLADEYPITAAMGQSNHNITTMALSRYVTALATSGDVYQYTLLSKVMSKDGDLVKTYEPELLRHVDVLDGEDWSAIHSGMKGVVDNSSIWSDFQVAVAGKTGTAQQVKNRANHALFIGYAPYSSPKVSITTRIAYGYTSHNAAEVSKNILAYYFGLEDTDDLLSGEAAEVSEHNVNDFTD